MNYLFSQKPEVGKCVFLQDGNRYIFYLITKEKYWQKPSLNSLVNSLKHMNELMNKYKLKSVSMPKIGCGLDKLEWKDVSLQINKILNDKRCTVYYI